MLGTKFNVFCFLHSRASNSKVNSLILPEFELVQDFMNAKVICNSHKDIIKSKHRLCSGEGKIWEFSALRGK